MVDVVNVKQNGDLETRGINDYGKRLTHSFIPHPKKDPHTGELFIAGVSYTPPYAIYNVVTKEGVMSNPVPIKMSGPSYMHDLEHGEIARKFGSSSLAADKSAIWHPSNIHDDDKIKWFNFDDSFLFQRNSWEEEDGDTIIFICCLMRPDIPVPSNAISNDEVPSLASAGNLMSNLVPKKTKTFFRPAHVYNGPKIRRNLTPRQVYNGPILSGTRKLPMVGFNIDENITSESTHDNVEEESVGITLPTL
ncbi:hypothetical protein Leryth_023144 [Lithospermum erythrorhizon]|nr:hypothetical protein Leryth_023144 [Lithospermum erythrorhizon]